MNCREGTQSCVPGLNISKVTQTHGSRIQDMYHLYERRFLHELLCCIYVLHCQTKHYRIFADNLFMSMKTITACYLLTQLIFLSGTAAIKCVGYPIERENYLKLSAGEYEVMYSIAPPAVVAVVWCDSGETRFLGAGACIEESSLKRRKSSRGSE